MKQYDILIIGGGPGGMAAAVAAYDLGCRSVAILERDSSLGGVLNQCIHPGFGLHKLGQELTGPEYAAVYEKMVREKNIPVFTESCVISLDQDKTVTVQNREGILRFHPKAVILAMGCRERPAGALRLPGSRPAGIYSAGTAQKLINCMGTLVGKEAVILGSGDIGLIMARRMTLEGAKVRAVCEIMPYSGGLKRNIVQCLNDFSIPLLLSTTVTKIHGKERLEAVTVAKVDENRRPIPETEETLPCDTLLLSVGLIPENELTESAGIPLDPVTLGAQVDENCRTHIPGIFACGNVLQVHDLVDFVSEEGERAGKAAARFVLGEEEEEEKATLSLSAGNGIRYVIPQRIHPQEKGVSLFFRVREPMENVRFYLSHGEEKIPLNKKRNVAPGEMEKILLPANLVGRLKQPLTLSLEVEK